MTQSEDSRFTADLGSGISATKMISRERAAPAPREQIREWHPHFSNFSEEGMIQTPFTEGMPGWCMSGSMASRSGRNWRNG